MQAGRTKLKNVVVTAVALAIAAFSCLLVYDRSRLPGPAPEPEPKYRERELSIWFHQLHYGAPEEAGAAFREFGTEAIGPLERRLRANRDSALRRAHVRVWQSLPPEWAQRLPQPQPYNPELAFRVAVAWSHAGTPIKPRLEVFLGDPNQEVRRAAEDAIRLIDGISLQP